MAASSAADVTAPFQKANVTASHRRRFQRLIGSVSLNQQTLQSGDLEQSEQ